MTVSRTQSFLNRMQCSSCGELIPIEGQICSYCGADKTADRLAHEAALFERQRRTGKILIWSMLLFFLTIIGGASGFGFDHSLKLDGLCTATGLAAGLTLGALIAMRIADKGGEAFARDLSTRR